MKTYTYAGALKPSMPSNNFGTSLFKDEEGDYFIQEEENEVISSFSPIVIRRELIPPVHAIAVKEGDPFIYSYLSYSGDENEGTDTGTDKTELIYGARWQIEQLLLPLIDEESITVHARLMISSFLKLFQTTIRLVEASNKDLETRGVEQKIKENIPFQDTVQNPGQTDDILSSIWERYLNFSRINGNIRVDDIVFLSGHHAYFIHYNLRMERIVNKKCLQKIEHRKMVSEVIMSCTKKDKHLLRTILHTHTESYDFIVQSEFILFLQSEIESFLSEKISHGDLYGKDISVLDIGLELDKKIHADPSAEEMKDVNNVEITDPSLRESMLSIIAKMH
jgi:hypothetical protein